MKYFAEDTTFFQLEIILFRGNEPYYRDKFSIRPPIGGIANRDNQVSYFGTYTAQFRQKQENLPTVQLGRLRFFNFIVPRTMPDPEMILENELFQRELEFMPSGLKPFSLVFFGVTKNNQINLASKGVYVEEQVINL